MATTTFAGQLLQDITPTSPPPVNVYRWHFGRIIEAARVPDDDQARPNTSCAAQVLQQLIYRTESLAEYAPRVFEGYVDELRLGVEGAAARSGWIRRSAAQMSRELGEQFSRSACDRALRFLVAVGFLAVRSNPEDARDQTNQYRVDLVAIRRALEEHYEMPGELAILAGAPRQLELGAKASGELTDRALEEQVTALREQVVALREQLATQGEQHNRDPQRHFQSQEKEKPRRRDNREIDARGAGNSGSAPAAEPGGGEEVDRVEEAFRAPDLPESLRGMGRALGLGAVFCDAAPIVAARILEHVHDGAQLRTHLLAKLTRLAASHRDRPGKIVEFLIADAAECEAPPRHRARPQKVVALRPEAEVEPGRNVVVRPPPAPWATALALLQAKVGDERSLALLGSLQCVRCEADEVELAHEDDFVRDWIRDHYLDRVEAACREVMGRGVEVRLTGGEEPGCRGESVVEAPAALAARRR